MGERFISAAKARRILGKDAKPYSDKQLEEIIDILYESSEFSYQKWVSEKKIL